MKKLLPTNPWQITFTLVVIVVLTALLINVLRDNESASESAIETYAVDRQDVQRKVSFDGVFVPQNSRTIFPSATGRLELEVELGDKVDEGDKIAEQNIVDQFGNEEIEEITSPIDGTIVELLASSGQTVSSSSPIAVIANLNNLEIEAQIDETYIDEIEGGMEVSFTVQALEKEGEELQEFSGEGRRILPVADRQTGLYTMLIEITEDNDSFKNGMSVDLELQIAGCTEDNDEFCNVVAVDRVYIFERDEEYFVKRLQTNSEGELTTEDIQIEPGVFGDTYVAINSGLSVDDQLILPQEELTDNDSPFGF